MTDKHHQFDVAVLGGGPGGYPAAIKAAQFGKSVALIEAKQLGGTCLNRGCIPSKTLIAAAELLKRMRLAEQFGIAIGGTLRFDFEVMSDHKDMTVTKMRKSLEGLIQSNHITVFQGHGKFVSPHSLKIMGSDNATIEARNIIIATGSEPKNFSSFPSDGKKILDSTSLLELKQLPKSIVIVGGGIIGCEFASLYHILGVDVTIIEMLESIIPMENQGVSSFLTKSFLKRGIKIFAPAIVKSIESKNEGVLAMLADGQSIASEVALIAIGRTLNTSGIGLEQAGVMVEDNGLIKVNSRMETNVPGIYAVGDIASKWWLAHVATHQGIVAAKNVCGEPSYMHYDAIPSVIFTDPEIGTVGLSLEAAKEKGLDAVIGVFPFQALGKAQASLQTEGFAQVVIDRPTGQILGAQVVGHEASSLISEMSVAITNELTLESITESIHPHPTLSEAWPEAALQAGGSPLHLPPKRQERTT